MLGMKKPTKAVYAGHFDPPTMGHCEMIEKASRLFDQLEIVVASNAEKTESFSAAERVKMLSQVIDSIRRSCVVTVSVLPPQAYLVDYAASQGATFLVRGIRDPKDFMYERDIYKVNRKLGPQIETAYLMPDTEREFISSSMVRGLVGLRGWRERLDNSGFVPPEVMPFLSRWHAKRLLRKLLLNEPYFGTPSVVDELWRAIEEHYCAPERVYHNIDHILDCLETLDDFGIDSTSISLALWLHDITDDVDESAELASNIIFSLGHRGLFRNDAPDTFRRISSDVRNLILATRHDDVPLQTAEACIMASVDLAVLARPWPSYCKYTDAVFTEYFFAQRGEMDENTFYLNLWVPSRGEFLEGMLRRERIYPWPRIEAKLEKRARDNLAQELAILKGDKHE